MKKLIGAALAAVMSVSGLTLQFPAENSIDTAGAAGKHNYAEALQKSLYFYECQQAGVLPDWNRVEWRGDGTVDDYITGGWYDAGDHVKFNLPMAYSAAMLAWGLYEYPDGVKKIGQWEIYQNNLEYTLDYLAACDLGDEVVFQVGNGTEDHTWWGPVELVEYGMTEGSLYKRPYYTGTGAAVCGEMAAALAAGYCALKDTSSKADNYLKHAENIFKIADTSRSNEDYNNSDASGFYRSSHFYDELFWSANWLYIATGNSAYLDKATSYIPNLDKELGSSDMKYSWTQCWDDVMQGGMLLYARNTKNPTYISHVQRHVEYWTSSVSELDGGLRWLSDWGCLRYATAAAFVASVACDTVLTDTSAVTRFRQFYEEQINYCLGSNPSNRSYVVGYGENYPKNPHHRTAHGSWKNAMDTPTVNRHTLYGALVGGPTSSGDYEDDRGNYINNEVATDYNAGFTALLCKMVDEYGGTTDPDFPEPETREQEFYVEVAVKESSASGATLALKFTNHTAWPARIEDNMSYRYYVDLSEVISAGYTANDVVIRCDRDQAKMYSECEPAQISGFQLYDGTVYYIEVTYPDGRVAMPISEGRHQCETILALVFPNYGSGWDSSNDYSFDGLSKDPSISNRITIYQNGVLLYGTEPDGTTPDNGTETPSITGDINSDGKVSTADLTLLKAHVLNKKLLSSAQASAADINGDAKINAADIASLIRKIS